MAKVEVSIGLKIGYSITNLIMLLIFLVVFKLYKHFGNCFKVKTLK